MQASNLLLRVYGYTCWEHNFEHVTAVPGIVVRPWEKTTYRSIEYFGVIFDRWDRQFLL